MKKPLVSALLSGAILLTVGTANSWADTITFNNTSLHPDGTLSVGSTISLSNGVIDSVARVLPLAGFNITGTCGPSGNQVFGCINLTTGTFIGPDASTAANDYDYNGGGVITITGGISSGTLNLPNGTVLWTGSFDALANVLLQFDDDCNIIVLPGQALQCTGSVTGTLAPGTLNPLLAAALGVSPTTVGGNDQNLFFSYAGITLGNPTGSGQGNTNQVQVVTPAVTAAVPESGSLILVGMGLVAGAKYLRRRKIA